MAFLEETKNNHGDLPIYFFNGEDFMGLLLNDLVIDEDEEGEAKSLFIGA